MSLSHRCAEATGSDESALRAIAKGQDNLGYGLAKLRWLSHKQLMGFCMWIALDERDCDPLRSIFTRSRTPSIRG